MTKLSQKEGNWIKEREEIGTINALINTVDSIQLDVKGYQFSKLSGHSLIGRIEWRGTGGRGHGQEQSRGIGAMPKSGITWKMKVEFGRSCPGCLCHA